MVRVKLLTSMAGPEMTWNAGEEHEVDEAYALRLQAAGFATVVAGHQLAAIGHQDEPAVKPKRTGSKKKTEEVPADGGSGAGETSNEGPAAPGGDTGEDGSGKPDGDGQ
jgi:hypothetical protein